MPRYRFRAADAAGRVVEGVREGADDRALARSLRAEGLTPLDLSEARAPRRALGLRRGRPRRMGADAMVLFTGQLATLVEARLPLDQALGSIAGQDDGSGMAAVANDVLGGVRRGASLADALAGVTAAGRPVFSRGYVALVRAGEASGALGRVLEDLAQSLSRSRALEREVRGALTYPAVVLAATVAALGLLLGAVIPEFAPLFEDVGDALPLNARIVRAASDLVRGFWREGLIGLMVIVLAAIRLARLDAVRRRIDVFLMRVPVVGGLIAIAEAARFTRALATLLTHGVEVAPALEMSVATLRNRHLADRLEAAIARVRRGEGVAGPLEAADALPPLAIQLIRAGESASRLPAMLDTAAGILEADLRRRMQQVVSLVTPGLTILLGLVVALVIGAVLGAIMSTYDLPF